MAADPVATPGSASEAYEKGVSTPVNKHANSSTGGPQKQRGCCAPVTKGSIIIGFGVFLVVLGVVYGTALPAVVNSQIDAGVVTCKVKDALDEAFTDRYGDCDDCTPYYYSLSMFNVTNAMDYLEKGAKLQVKEVGPYTYRRREIRVDVELSSDSNTVSYKTYTYHTYVPEKSCESCSDKDSVISWDVGYLNVISQAGGEVGFVTQLIKGTIWGGSLTDEQIADVIAKNGTQVMRWVNGLNSNEPKAWKNIGSSVLGFLTTTVTAVTSLDLTGFEYNGLFVRRSISQWALGYPSLLAGLALGSNYVEKCNVTGGFETQCATCKGDECNKIYAECKKCETGRKVMLINDVTCGVIKDTYAAVYGATEAETFVSSTCKSFCKAVGLCAAPLPGAAEDSGLDYSKQAPPSSALNTYIQRTGCDDKTKIGEYIQYDGFRTQPLWAKLDKRRNPTLEEINAFQVYGNCAAKTDNMTCIDVMGQDATGIKPAGTSIKGFPSKAEVSELQMYLIQGKQNISVVNTGVVVDDISGIKMSRFSPPNDLLIAADWKESHGTAYPVNGVQPMAFNVGFLAWVSYPFFLYGDKSLLEGVEITMFDGNIASVDTMYENGELKEAYADRYVTTLDIEPGTGKAMRARKRLMASYGVAGSQFTKNAPMTDLVWPNLTAEVISPAYIGEESATITPDLVDTFKGVKTIISTLLPVLIVGIVLGVALAGYGFLYRRKAVLARKTAMGEAV